MDNLDEDLTLRDSLLQWLQSFSPDLPPPQNSSLDTWSTLTSGTTLWAILQQIDPTYFSGTLPEPSVSARPDDWTRRWQNLKYLERQVSIYYRQVRDAQDESDGVDTASLTTTTTAAHYAPDLKAIAADASVPEMEKLVMLIIRMAMASPESNQKMAQRLIGLGREHAMAIANGLREMEVQEGTETEEEGEEEQREVEEDGDDDVFAPKVNGSGAGLYADPMLEREEELLQAQATVDKLQASQEEAQRQLQVLRLDKERLQDAFDSYRMEFENNGRRSAADEAFDKLQRQTENDRAYIDDLEHQLQASRGNVENYGRQIERLKADSESSQSLRDELQVLRAENDELNHKIKANENLKKKIQTLQEQDKANATLREQLKQSNERLGELDRLKQVQAGLEKEIIEKKGLIRNQEYQINELTTTRKHAEYDARVLAQKLEAARERHERDHDAIEELRSQQLAQADAHDTTIDDTQDQNDAQSLDEPSLPQPSSDESKAHAEQIALLEQQLSAADVRLKQASQRTADLEERDRQHIEVSSQTEQHIAEHQATITSLRAQLEAATTSKPIPAPTPQPPQPAPQASTTTSPSARDLAILQRENRLMASAWYDLSARLQRDGVSLGRRKYEPKSWIGKQRALVGPGVALSSGRS